jgi:geranylgeranyl diphosphate synthase type I
VTVMPASTPHARPRAADLMTRSRKQIDPALRAATRDLDEPVRAVVSYHFGWTTPDGRPADAAGPGGAAGAPGAQPLHSTVALTAARALDVPAGIAVAAAAAVELAHNSSLLQQDAINRNRARLGRPTAWRVFGEAQAMLAGDALAVLALSMLLRDGGQWAATATKELSGAYQDLVAGQALDIGCQPRSRVTVGEYRRIAEAKTASLLACASSLSAVLVGADAATVGALHAFGRHLGLASQFAEDIRGIWGGGCAGEPVGRDIRARRKSLPVAYALSMPEAWRLGRFYALTHEPAPEEVAQVAEALAAVGARAWASAEVTGHLDAAIDSLREAGLKPAQQADLAALTRLGTDPSG